MTQQEQCQAWLPLVEAVANGATLQIFVNDTGEWRDYIGPINLISSCEYRLKPEQPEPSLMDKFFAWLGGY
jgi:hypothetical protein